MLNKYMDFAIKKASEIKKDIPVCAVITKGDEILSFAVNEREEKNRVTSHAEILALNLANEKLNSWRLEDCNMYVTLEPCPMCAWAILNARIKNLYFGCWDIKYGAFGGAINLAALANSKINFQGGIMEDECQKLIERYFNNLRGKNERKA